MISRVVCVCVCVCARKIYFSYVCLRCFLGCVQEDVL